MWGKLAETFIYFRIFTIFHEWGELAFNVILSFKPINKRIVCTNYVRCHFKKIYIFQVLIITFPRTFVHYWIVISDKFGTEKKENWQLGAANRYFRVHWKTYFPNKNKGNYKDGRSMQVNVLTRSPFGHYRYYRNQLVFIKGINILTRLTVPLNKYSNMWFCIYSISTHLL